MAKSLYILNLDLLHSKFKFLTNIKKEQVSRLAVFVGVYYGRWFLQCSLAASAPYRTIQSFRQMLEFSEHDNHLAFTVMDSMRRHTWYITEQWVVVSLFDKECPVEEKIAVARALAETPQPSQFKPGKPVLPVEFWPESGEIPSLKNFVGPYSWLLPHILDIPVEDMEWLNMEVNQWPHSSGLGVFKKQQMLNFD